MAEECLNESCKNAEGKRHSFQFRIRNGETNKVVCDTSQTVFGALNKNSKFKSGAKDGKEIIIKRPKGQTHGAAVNTDFPCCLIEDDETLQINFYKNEEIEPTNQETTIHTDPKSLVIFYIRTRGKITKKIMKSNVFLNIDYVCVFAHQGDTLKNALQHDGRFIDDIFDGDCVLFDDKAINYELNMPVDFCNGKTFELNGTYKKPQVTSVKNDGESFHYSQQKKNTKQKPVEEKKTMVTDSSTEGHATASTSGNSSGDSGHSFFTDIQNILQTLCKDLLNQLKQQENSQDGELLRKDYDKGVVECFTEVNKVRRVMELSDSVCVIAIDSIPRGTGFLLFDRFILTNAHVVKDDVYLLSEHPCTYALSGTLTAVFNYEAIESEVKVLPVKSVLIAWGFKKDDKLRYLDFALLELDTVKPDNCPELLNCYKHGPSPNSGGIYIVGHPGCGFKKMDPCFIIGIENQLQSINKHISENVSCPYVSLQCWPYLYKNQITYDSCFLHGSSGSPVFDEHCHLIGMHTGGFDYKEGETTRSVIEFSYSMQPILESIITQVKTTRRDILKLLSTFKPIQAHYNLGNIEDAYEANMLIKEELESEIEKMEHMSLE
ncbi:serine protease FAM111A isoform X2 [Pseudorasbora parva]|uniref:serine protease FAM111A isoform X2 n=1 Tax=Pseudorasbora parva TaxID=51549 RepID=UPI00351E41B9